MSYSSDVEYSIKMKMFGICGFVLWIIKIPRLGIQFIFRPNYFCKKKYDEIFYD